MVVHFLFKGEAVCGNRAAKDAREEHAAVTCKMCQRCEFFVKSRPQLHLASLQKSSALNPVGFGQGLRRRFLHEEETER